MSKLGFRTLEQVYFKVNPHKNSKSFRLKTFITNNMILDMLFYTPHGCNLNFWVVHCGNNCLSKNFTTPPMGDSDMRTTRCAEVSHVVGFWQASLLFPFSLPNPSLFYSTKGAHKGKIR